MLVAIGPLSPDGRNRISTSYRRPSAVGTVIALMTRWPSLP